MQSRDGSAGAEMWLVRGPSDRAAAARGGVRFSANVAAFAYLHVHSRGRRPCRRNMHVPFPGGDTPARRLHVHSVASSVHAIFCTCIFLSDAPDGRLLHVHFRAGTLPVDECTRMFPAAVAPARLLRVQVPAGTALARLSGRANSGGSHAGRNLHVHFSGDVTSASACTPGMTQGRRARGDCTPDGPRVAAAASGCTL
jgi:hypothetical protein